jgi:hypothetical protein
LQSRAEQPNEVDAESVQPAEREVTVDSSQTVTDVTPSDEDLDMTLPERPQGDADGDEEHTSGSDGEVKEDDNETIVGTPPSTKVVGRPIFFASEFVETGGAGLPRKNMTEVLDNNEQNRSHIIEVLEDTGHMLLGHTYSAEEGEAVSVMSARSFALYAKMRLERENQVINDAIWRVQKIVDDNKAEISELDARIAHEEEKQKYFARLDDEMKSTHTTINDRLDTLASFSGTKDDSDEEGRAEKPSWKDRARKAKQAKVGVQWRYQSKEAQAGGKGKEVERRQSSQATLNIKPVTPEVKHMTTPTASSGISIDRSAVSIDEGGSNMGDFFNAEGDKM